MSKSLFKLRITCNTYVGNLEQELCAYVFGYAKFDCHDWVEKLNNLAEKELGEEVIDELSEVVHCFYDEHGDTICNIESENVLIIHLDKNPEKYLKTIIQRIKNFTVEYVNAFEYADKNVQILSVELIEQKISETITKLL